MSETKAITLQSILSEDSVKKRFQEILGQRAPAFISSILSLQNANQQLRDADPRSIMAAAVIAATLDLPINQSLGFAFIVPYGNYAQFQIGAKGLVQLAIRTAQYKTIHVSDVFKDEIARWDALSGVFESTAAETWKLRDKGDAKDVAGYLAYFRLLNGFEKHYYMTVDQIRAHGKRYSKSFENPKGVWMQNFDAMARKTVLKLLLSKYGLLSIQMEKAIEADQGVIDTTGEIIYPDRAEEAPVATKPTGAGKKINDDQIKLLFARIDKSGIEKEEVKRYVKDKYALEHFHGLTVEQLTEVLRWLEQDPEDK